MCCIGFACLGWSNIPGKILAEVIQAEQLVHWAAVWPTASSNEAPNRRRMPQMDRRLQYREVELTPLP